MRASTAVSLLLVSSLSIFGIFGKHQSTAALEEGLEPVWVNGVMGVYNPETGLFVPSTSPLFDQTCELIQRRRQQANGSNGGSSGYYHHWVYYPWNHSFSYSTGGASGLRSNSGTFSHMSSVRGGFGATGHSFGGAHS